MRQIAILDTAKFPILWFPQKLKLVTSIILEASLFSPKEISRKIETSYFSRRVNIPQRDNHYFYSVANWWKKIAVMDTAKFPILWFPQILQGVTSIILEAPLISPKDISSKIETSPFSRRVNIAQKRQPLFLEFCRLVRQIAILDTAKCPILWFPQILQGVTKIILE